MQVRCSVGQQGAGGVSHTQGLPGRIGKVPWGGGSRTTAEMLPLLETPGSRQEGPWSLPSSRPPQCLSDGSSLFYGGLQSRKREQDGSELQQAKSTSEEPAGSQTLPGYWVDSAHH